MLDLIRQRSASWGVKIAFGIIILVFVFWGVGSYNTNPPGVVATVNGKPVLMQDFQREMAEQQEQFRAMAPDMSWDDMKSLRIPEQILSRMVGRALVEQEAKHIGLVVTPVEYAAFIHNQPAFRDKDGKYSEKLYRDYVSAQRQNIADFEQGMMRDMLIGKMQDYVASAVTVTSDEAKRRASFDMEQRVMSFVLFPTEEYRADIAISDEAVNAYYDGNQAQFAQPAAVSVNYLDVTPASLAPAMEVADEDVEKAFLRGPSRYNLREVLVPVPEGTDEAAEGAMRVKLGEVAALLREGKELSEAASPLVEAYPDAQAGESGMMDSRRIPEEVLGSLAGLKKGDVGPIVKMEKMLVLSQLVDTSPDWSLPEAEVKAALRAELAEDKASLVFRDEQAQAEDLVALGKPLAEIAKALKVEPRASNMVPRDELGALLGLRKAGQTSLFDGPKGTLVNAILETREGFVVAEIADSKPSGVKPLEEVADTIRDALTEREAAKKAEEDARKAAPEFADGIPDAYKDKVVTSAPFDRRGNIQELGFAKTLSDAVFAAPLDKWLKEPYATPKGAVIVMPAEAVAMSDDTWARVEELYLSRMLQSKKAQIVNAFVGDLHKKADVRVTNPEIFQQ